MTGPAWRIVPTVEFEQGLRKIDRAIARRVIRTLDAIAESGNPRSRGKPLRHELSGLWRYRIGNYRVLAELRDNDLVILALDVDHRSTVYGN